MRTYDRAAAYADASDALRAASRLSFARAVRSSRSSISSRPKLRWSTTSKIRSFRASGNRVARSRRPMVRWTSRCLLLLDQTVGRLLHPVVLEAELLHDERRKHVLHVSVAASSDSGRISSSCTAARRLSNVCCRRRLLDQRKRVDVESIADAGGELQRLLRLRGKPPQFPEEQIDHVVRDVARI